MFFYPISDVFSEFLDRFLGNRTGLGRLCWKEQDEDLPWDAPLWTFVSRQPASPHAQTRTRNGDRPSGWGRSGLRFNACRAVPEPCSAMGTTAYRFETPRAAFFSFSCSRRAVLCAVPWGLPSCGRPVLPSCVPAYLQSWWYLPLITSFAAISSGFPTNRVDVRYMLTGIAPPAKAALPLPGPIHRPHPTCFQRTIRIAMNGI